MAAAEEHAHVPSRYGALSPRQRECLRLVYDHKTSKEIERELGIAKSTIDGYLAEAVRTLEARDRKHAALLLAEHEGRGPQVRLGGYSARVVETPATEAAVQPPGRTSEARSLLPLRRKGSRHNPLSPGERALWIVSLAVLMMIGFGMLVSGLAVLTDILKALGSVRG